MKIKIDGKKTISALDKLIAGLDSAVDRGLMWTAYEGQNVAKAKSKGSVSASIGVTQTRDGYELQARAPHAKYVEHGRKAITAKKGHFLRFEVSGRVVFARKVRAARPRPFMRPAGRVMNTNRFVEQSLAQLMRGSK